jgi:glycosyltransferase involved in cell wall biosynthesis
MEELPLFYNLADVIVSVPSTDGMPVTIFEAMACRKPLIVGDLPSYNEVIIHGQTGLRVPVRNHQALAQAIVKMAKNQNELVDRMVDESQLILQQYGVFEQQMQRMERYYFALKNKRIQAPNDWNKVMGGACFKLLAAFT